MFALPSYAYYEIDLSIGDIIYFKAYLLGHAIAQGGTASLRIGLSKDGVNTKELGANDIVGIDTQFDEEYVFHSGDPYYSEKEFDSLLFFDYSLVSISSPNFEEWDGTGEYSLEKLIDRNTNTYMHTKRNTPINSDNPLTLIFNLGRKYYFDYIYFARQGYNNYVPKTLVILISEDNNNWNEIGTFTTSQENDINKVEIFLEDKVYTQYVKIHITEASTINPGYIALNSVEFIERNTLYYQKKPEFPHIGNYSSETNNVVINFDNFPYFGHSYVLKQGTFMKFNLEEITGVRIKVCNKYDSKVEIIVKNNNEEVKNDIVEIKANDNFDFPLVVNGLSKGNYSFVFNIEQGSIDLEYILYQV